jgi:hypothetical protein
MLAAKVYRAKVLSEAKAVGEHGFHEACLYSYVTEASKENALQHRECERIGLCLHEQLWNAICLWHAMDALHTLSSLVHGKAKPI